jgi:hypothetical protein
LENTGGTPAWSQILSNATIQTALGIGGVSYPYKILASINYDQYLAMFFQTSSSLYVCYTGDSRAATPSWNFRRVGQCGTNFGSQGFRGSADIVPYVNGSGSLTLYALSAKSSVFDTGIIAFKSTDAGNSWSQAGVINASGNRSPFAILVPYDDNEDGNRIYASAYFDDPAARGVYVSENGGANWSQLVTGLGYSSVKRWGIGAFTHNRQLMDFVIGGTLYLSNNALASYEAAAGSGMSGTIRSTGGFPYNRNQFYAVTSTQILLSQDRGETWTNKLGNHPVTASPNFLVSDSSLRAVIVPLWTE